MNALSICSSGATRRRGLSREVELEGERYEIRARVHQVGGYSAHAGQSDLLRFVQEIPEAPMEIRIVHGDADAKQALKRCFHFLRDTDIIIPAG